MTVEVGCWGCTAQSAWYLMSKVELRRLGEAAERASCWFWHKREETSWKAGGEGKWLGQSPLTRQLEGVVVKGQNTLRRLGTAWWPLFQAKAASITNRCMKALLMCYKQTTHFGHALKSCTQVNITVYDTVPKSLRNNSVVKFRNASLSTMGTRNRYTMWYRTMLWWTNNIASNIYNFTILFLFL